MTHTALRAGALAFAVSLAAPVALACTCPPYPTPVDHAAEYDVVLVGDVEGIELHEPPPPPEPQEYEPPKRSFWSRLAFWRKPPPPPPPSFFDPSRNQTPSSTTTVRVTRWLKGAGDETVSIFSLAPGTPTCGLRYPDSGSVVVLARRTDTGGYVADMCSLPVLPQADYEAAFPSDTDD